MEIVTVPTYQVHQAWPKVEAFLASALMHSDDYTIDQVRAQLGQGFWHLIVAESDGVINGACVVSFEDRFNHRVAFIHALGGRMIVGESSFGSLEALFRKCGATLVECAARPSTARLFSKVGLREKYAILEKEL